jgi:3-(3-hydroxy-phenyl)propionate hydroxylase
LNVLTGEDASDVQRWLAEHSVQAALIRPDRYVRGAARSEAELDLLIATACAAADVPTAA